MAVQQVSVVTGAAGALGSVVTRHLLEQGHRVAAVDRPEAAEQLAELAASEACFAAPLDVCDGDGWASALERIRQALGPPTGAVLTAGGWGGGAAFADPASEPVWREMLDKNLETARRSLEALLPGMVERNRGSVVVVGSRAAQRPWESVNAAAYAASKAALVALSQVAAAEVLEAGVRVNAVLPSMIDTPANRSAMPDADTSRWVTPQSLADVIAFLLSDAARDVSGAALPVYGRA